MKLTGIFRDSTPNNIPNGFAWDIKNFLNLRKLGVLINEFGSIIFQKPITEVNNKYNLAPLYIPFPTRRQEIGKIPIDNDKTVIFSIGYAEDVSLSTEIKYSEIGIIDKNGYYQYILNDYDNTIFTSDNKLSFNPDYIITGEYTYNYNNDLIVAFTDGNKKPKLINLTYYQNNIPSVGIPFDINDILMFPDKNLADIDIDINDNGGTLKSGSYSVTYKYSNSGKTETDYAPIDNPFSIYSHNTLGNILRVEGDAPDTSTTKSVTFTFTNVDTRFNTLTISIIKKINGIVTAEEVKQLNISSSTLVFTYTGSESTTPIDISSVRVSKAYFEKIDGFTQVSKRLYAYGLTEQQRVNFQLQALDIELTGLSKSITPTAIDTSKLKEHFYNEKGFQHREVYAFYIHLIYANGKLSEGFHIPCADKSTYASDPTDLTSWTAVTGYKKYQVEDTTEIISIATETEIKLGYWENTTELYPDLPEFGTLANTPVRHHRFPSLCWTSENIYSGDPLYGITKMDILGIKANNVVIPPDILYNNGIDDTDGYRIKGWTLSYAKRSYENCTVIGQSQVCFEQQQSVPAPTIVTFTGSGLNTNMGFFDGATSYLMTMNGYRQRFFDFSLIRNQPSFSPVFITHELIYGNTPAYDNTTVTPRVAYGVNLIDSLNTNCTSVKNDGAGFNFAGNKYQAIDTYDYIPAQAVLKDYNHIRNEDSLVLKTIVPFFPVDMTAGTKNFSLGIVAFGALVHQSTLASLCAVPANIYETFYNQELIQTGKYFIYSDTTGNFYKGDIFINYYEFHSTTWATDPSHIYNYAGDKGVVTWWTYLCEQRDNVGLRYTIDSDVNTYHYPESNLFSGFYILGIDRDTIVLSKTYNNDYSQLNDLNIALPYNPFLNTVVKHNYRINRTIDQNEEEKRLSWSIWLINDYYESVKNKGIIKNIQGVDRNLYINHEQALYLTVGNEELDNNGSSTYIGVGNIFERQAEEILPSNEGTIGTTNKLSCLLTKYGYLVVDRFQGRVWLITGREATELSAQGLTEFFKENLDYEITVAGSQIPEDNPYFYFGLSAAFDNTYERLVLVKKAYEPTQKFIDDYNDSKILYEYGRWIYSSGLDVFVISYQNTDYWTSKSFTISYSFDNSIDKSSWCSFHDYIPDVIYNTRNLLLGIISDTNNNSFGTKIYKHNYKQNKCIFYNSTIVDIDTDTESATPYSSYIVPVFNTQDEIDKLFFNVYWIIQLLNSNKAYLNETQGFDKLLAWNSYQSTQDTALTPFIFADFSSNCRKINHTWNFNDLRDWLRTDILTNPNPPKPFIINSDLNPDLSPPPIDTNKSFELLYPLIDKFLFVKLLYFNPRVSNLQNEIQVVEVGTEYQIVPR